MAFCIKELSGELQSKFYSLQDALGRDAALSLLNSGTEMLSDPLWDDMFQLTGNSESSWLLLAKKYNSKNILALNLAEGEAIALHSIQADAVSVEQLYPDGVMEMTEEKGDIDDMIRNLTYEDSFAFLLDSKNYDHLSNKWNALNKGMSLDEFREAIRSIKSTVDLQTFEFLSELVTAAVDNTKLLVLDKLNLDDSALRMAALSVSYDIPLVDIIGILKDRDIRTLLNDFNKATDISTKGNYFMSLSRFIEKESPLLSIQTSKYNAAERAIKTSNATINELKRLSNVNANDNEPKSFVSDKDYNDGLLDQLKETDQQLIFTIRTPLDISKVRKLMKAKGITNFLMFSASSNSLYKSEGQGKQEYKIDLENAILIDYTHTNKIGEKSLKKELINTNKKLEVLTDTDEIAKLVATQEKELESLDITYNRAKYHSVFALKELLKLTDENSPIISIMGLKKGSQNSPHATREFIKTFEKSIDKIIDDSEFGNFSLKEFALNEDYRLMTTIKMEESVSFINPLLMIASHPKTMGYIQRFVTQENVGALTNELNPAVDAILDSMYMGREEMYQRNEVANTVFSYIISGFLKENNIFVNFNNISYNLSDNEEINKFIKAFPGIIRKMQLDHPESDFLQSINTDKSPDFSSKEEYYTLVDMFDTGDFESKMPLFQADIKETLSVEEQKMFMLYGLITKKGFKGSKNLATLFDSDFEITTEDNRIVKFDEYVANFDFDMFTPDSNGDLDPELKYGIILSNLTLLRSKNFNSDEFRRDKFGHVLFTNESINDGKPIVLSRVGSSFSVPTLSGTASIEEQINAAGWKFGYQVELPNGDTGRVVSYDDSEGIGLYTIYGLNETYTAAQLTEDGINPKMKFAGENFGFMTASELKSDTFDRTKVTAYDKGISISVSDINRRAKLGLSYFLVDKDYVKGQVIHSYYDNNIGSYVDIVYDGIHKGKDFRMKNQLTLNKIKGAIDNKAEFFVAKMVIRKMKRNVNKYTKGKKISVPKSYEQRISKALSNNAVDVIVEYNNDTNYLEEGNELYYDSLNKFSVGAKYNSLEEYMTGEGFNSVDKTVEENKTDALMFLGINSEKLDSSSFLAEWINGNGNVPYVVLHSKYIQENELLGNAGDELVILDDVVMEEESLSDYNDNTNIAFVNESQNNTNLFNKQGISITDSHGNLKPSKDLLERINQQLKDNDITDDMAKSKAVDIATKLINSDSVYIETSKVPHILAKGNRIFIDSIIDIAYKEDLRTLSEVKDYIDNSGIKDKGSLLSVIKNLESQKIDLYNIYNLNKDGNNITSAITNIVAKSIALDNNSRGDNPPLKIFVFSNNARNWYKFENGKYIMQPRIPIILQENALLSVRSKGIVSKMLLKKAHRYATAQLSSLGYDLDNDNHIDTTIDITEDYDNYEDLDSIEFFNHFDKRKVNKITRSKKFVYELQEGIGYVKEDNELHKVIDINGFKIRKYKKGNIITLEEIDGNRFIVLDSTSYNGFHNTTDKFMISKGKVFKFTGKVTYTSKEVFLRRDQNQDENKSINELKTKLSDLLEGTVSETGVKELLKKVRAQIVDESPNRDKLFLNLGRTITILNTKPESELNDTDGAKELLEVYNKYKETHDKYRSEIYELTSLFSSLVSISTIEKMSKKEINEEKAIVVYFAPSQGTIKEVSSASKLLSSNIKHDGPVILNENSKGEIIAFRSAVSSKGKSGSLNKRTVRFYANQLITAAIKRPNKTFYVEFPSNPNEEVISGLGFTYSDLSKYIVREFKSYSKANKGRSIPSNIKFDKNASRILHSTNGYISLSDIDDNKIYEVSNDVSQKLYSPFNYSPELIIFNNGETVLDKYNQALGNAKGTSLREDGNKTKSTAQKQEILNNLFNEYVNEDPSRLTKLMLDVKGRDLKSDSSSVSVSKAIVAILNSTNAFDFLYAKNIPGKFDGINMSKGYFVQALSGENDILFSHTDDGVAYTVRQSSEVRLFDKHNIIDKNVFDQIVEPALIKNGISIDNSNRAYYRTKAALETIMESNKTIKELLKNGNEYKRFGNFTAQENRSEVEMTDTPISSEEFNNRLKNVEFSDEGDASLAQSANIYLPIYPKTTVYGKNHKMISEEGLALSKALGNKVPSKIEGSPIVWIKSPKLNKDIYTNPKEQLNAFISIKKLLDYYIQNNVKFIVPKGSGIYEYVRAYLTKQGYAVSKNDNDPKGVLMSPSAKIVKFDNPISLISTVSSKQSDTMTINNSLSANNDSFGSLNGVVLHESNRKGTSVTIDGDKIVSGDTIIGDNNVYLDAIEFDSKVTITKEEAFDKMFVNKLLHEKKLAKRIAAKMIFGFSNNISLDEFNKSMTEYENQSEKKTQLEFYNLIINNIDSEFDIRLDNVKSYNIVGSHRNTLVYLNRIFNKTIKDNMYKGNISEMSSVKGGFIGDMITESNKFESGYKSTFLKMNNNRMSDIIEGDISVLDMFMLLGVLDKKTKSYKGLYNNKNVIDVMALNNVAIMKLDDKHVVFDTSAIKVNTGSAMEVLSKKEAVINPDSVENVIKHDEVLLRVMLKSKDVFATVNDDVVTITKMVNDKVEVVTEKTSSHIKVAYEIKKAVLSRLVMNKYLDVDSISKSSPLIYALNRVLNFTPIPSFNNFKNPFKYINATEEFTSDYRLDNSYIRTLTDQETGEEFTETIYINRGSNGDVYAFSKENEGRIYSIDSEGNFEIVSGASANANGIQNDIVVPYPSDRYYKRLPFGEDFIEGMFNVKKEGKDIVAINDNGDRYINISGNKWELSGEANVFPVSAMSNGHVGEVQEGNLPSQLLLDNDMVVKLDLDQVVFINPSKLKDGDNVYTKNANGLWSIESGKVDVVRFSKDFKGNKKQPTPFAKNLRKKLFGNVLTKIQELFPYMDIQSLNSANITSTYGKEYANKKAFTFGNIIVYNTDLMTLDTPIHELGHIYLTFLKHTDIKRYESIIASSLSSSYYDTVKSKYPELSEDELGEEIFTTLLGYHSQDSFAKDRKNEFNDIYEQTKGNTFFDFIIKLMNGLFGTNIRDIKIDSTLMDFIKIANNDLVKGIDMSKAVPEVSLPLIIKTTPNQSGIITKMKEEGHTVEYIEDTIRNTVYNKPNNIITINTTKSLDEFIGENYTKEEDGVVSYTESGIDGDSILQIKNLNNFSEENDIDLKNVRLTYSDNKLTDYFGSYERMMSFKQEYGDNHKYVGLTIAKLFSPEILSDLSTEGLAINKKEVLDIVDQLFSNTYPELFFDITRFLEINSPSLSFNNRMSSKEKSVRKLISKFNENNIFGRDRKIGLLAELIGNDKDQLSMISNMLFISDEDHISIIEEIDTHSITKKSKALKIDYTTYGINLENILNGIKETEGSVSNVADFLTENLNDSHKETFVKELLNPYFSKLEIQERMVEDKLLNKICS